MKLIQQYGQFLPEADGTLQYSPEAWSRYVTMGAYLSDEKLDAIMLLAESLARAERDLPSTVIKVRHIERAIGMRKVR